MTVAGLGDRPCERDPPEEDSLGINPRYVPIERPSSRCQFPISTASPTAVNVDTPRRQLNRVTTRVKALSEAIVVIAASTRCRRATVASMVPQGTSNVVCSSGRENDRERSRGSYTPVHAFVGPDSG